jgi:D-beta-D-heptose 7-phosphate kinase / D-beta-D-heptose 1-phosphate adenosyltransferase
MNSIVFTNGCFDIFHSGHLKILKLAKALGDRLIVGLNTDDSIKRIKGLHRPIIPYEDRFQLLTELQCVDLVIGFDEDTPINLIRTIQPDIIVKGGDYAVQQVVGYDMVDKVVIAPFYKNISTTKIIERIQRNENISS